MGQKLPPEDQAKRNNMNILGIDFGTKRIGLAWVQIGLDVILPFGVVEQISGQTIPEKLLSLIEKENINTLVIGLPLTLEDGTENPNTKRVRVFGDAVQKATGLPIVFVDERLTSFEADEMGGEASRDEKAAMVILQEYMQEHHS